MAKTYLVIAYPYATQSGTITVPDNTNDVNEYIKDHWDDIEFDEPDLDYCGTDFDIEEE